MGEFFGKPEFNTPEGAYSWQHMLHVSISLTIAIVLADRIDFLTTKGNYMDSIFISSDYIDMKLFKNKKVKLLIIDSSYKDFKELLLSFYKEVEVILIDNIYVAFCIDSYNQAISNFITTLSDDLGINLKIHEGITIKNNINGNIVLHYIGIIKEFFAVNDDLYSDSATVMLTTSLNSLKEYISIIDEHILSPVFKDSIIKDIILTYFKNDLNVSKTAKDLYINRNSLLNKFELIYKETGFNLQKFNHACAIYLFVLLKGNKQ